MPADFYFLTAARSSHMIALFVLLREILFDFLVRWDFSMIYFKNVREVLKTLETLFSVKIFLPITHNNFFSPFINGKILLEGKINYPFIPSASNIIIRADIGKQKREEWNSHKKCYKSNSLVKGELWKIKTRIKSGHNWLNNFFWLNIIGGIK